MLSFRQRGLHRRYEYKQCTPFLFYFMNSISLTWHNSNINACAKQLDENGAERIKIATLTMSRLDAVYD